MAQSLKVRFNGNREEVLEYTLNYGRGKAMDKYNVKDYVAFARFLTEVTGDCNYGIKAKLSQSGNQTLGDQLIEAIISKVSRMEAEKQGLNKRIEFLEWQLNTQQSQDDMRALAVLEVCKV